MFASAIRQVRRLAHEGLAAEIGPAAVVVQALKEGGEMNKHKLWKICEVQEVFALWKLIIL